MDEETSHDVLLPEFTGNGRTDTRTLIDFLHGAGLGSIGYASKHPDLECATKKQFGRVCSLVFEAFAKQQHFAKAPQRDGPAPLGEVLLDLQRHGGIFKGVADALLLMLKKSEDYNGGQMTAAAQAARDTYFPFGAPSYVHMIHTKSQRLVQIVRNDLDGKVPNFEGARDTCYDLINYAAFFIERMSRDQPGAGNA